MVDSIKSKSLTASYKGDISYPRTEAYEYCELVNKANGMKVRAKVWGKEAAECI